MDLDTVIAYTEIREVIALYAHAADRRRWQLMEHVFHDDARVDMSVASGPWRQWVQDASAVFDAAVGDTMHLNANTLINVEGAVAYTETYCIAYHRVRADAPPGGVFGGTGEPWDLIAGLRYIDRFDHRDGNWRISTRRLLADWRHTQDAHDGVLSTVMPDLRGSRPEEWQTEPLVTRWLR